MFQEAVDIATQTKSEALVEYILQASDGRRDVAEMIAAVRTKQSAK
jgi:hypothetical protein